MRLCSVFHRQHVPDLAQLTDREGRRVARGLVVARVVRARLGLLTITQASRAAAVMCGGAMLLRLLLAGVLERVDGVLKVPPQCGSVYARVRGRRLGQTPSRLTHVVVGSPSPLVLTLAIDHTHFTRPSRSEGHSAAASSRQHSFGLSAASL